MEDFAKILGSMKEAQELQQRVVKLQATGEAGAGAVKATVNGGKQLLQIVIEKEFIDPQESEMLQDLIVAAVNSAVEKVDNKAKEEVRRTTAGILEGGEFPGDLVV